MSKSKNLPPWSSHKNKIRLDRWVIVIFSVILTIVLAECTFDPISWLANSFTIDRIRSELPKANKLWESNAIDNYDVDVAAIDQPTCFLDKTTLHIRHGQIDGIPETNDISSYRDYCLYYFQHNGRVLTASAMLQSLQREILTVDIAHTSLQVDFDPKYGFVTMYRRNCNYRIDILYPAYPDCIDEFEFTNFHPLSSP